LGHTHDALEPLLLIRKGFETKANLAPVVAGSIVSPEYFHLLGMPLLRGRLFSEQDLEDTPQVAVINQAAAQTYWPAQDPVGKRFRKELSSGRRWRRAGCGRCAHRLSPHGRTAARHARRSNHHTPL
jgi:hypothetical protein